MDELLGVLTPQLRALVEIVDQGGRMTEAAGELGIPQSTMSRRLHGLENHLGVPLLIPSGRTVTLSPAALDLAEAVRRPLHEISAALADVTGSADPDHGVVRFGFPLTMGSGQIPDLLAAFSSVHPGIRLELKQGHGTELVADLRAGRIDLAIIIPPPHGLEHRVLEEQEIIAALPSDHSLVRRTAGNGRPLRLSTLAEERFIANPPTYNLRTVTEQWCRDAGFTAKVKTEVTEFSTIREFVSRGMGVALVPRSVRPMEGLAEVELAGRGYARQVSLCSVTRRLPPVAVRLSEFIGERAAFWRRS